MAYVLRDGLFQVKCRQQGCPFKSEFKIEQTIMGATSDDCEVEAIKIATNMAAIKHDAIYGRSHRLEEPQVRKVGGVYVPFGPERVGAAAVPEAGRQGEEAAIPRPPGAVAVRRYAKGQVILRKGDRATTVCEVIEGAACPENAVAIRYQAGRSFGAAGLLTNQERTGSVLAESDGTIVAFYNMAEIAKTNPAKARELYNEVMEDTLHVIAYLDSRVDELEAEIATLKAKARAARPAARKAAARPAKARPAAARSGKTRTGKGGAGAGKAAGRAKSRRKG